MTYVAVAWLYYLSKILQFSKMDQELNKMYIYLYINNITLYFTIDTFTYFLSPQEITGRKQ